MRLCSITLLLAGLLCGCADDSSSTTNNETSATTTQTNLEQPRPQSIAWAGDWFYKSRIGLPYSPDEPKTGGTPCDGSGAFSINTGSNEVIYTGGGTFAIGGPGDFTSPVTLFQCGLDGRVIRPASGAGAWWYHVALNPQFRAGSGVDTIHNARVGQVSGGGNSPIEKHYFFYR